MNRATRPCVSVVGSLHFDIMVQAPYLPRTGETLIGEAWWWKAGGKGGNQAIAAARHGADVEFIGSLGDDGFGARLRGQLQAAGIGLTHVHTAQQGSGMSVAIQLDSGDYAAIVVSGANRDIDPTHVAASGDAIADSRVLVLQNEITESANIAAARLAREARTLVVLNAAPMRPMTALDGLVDVLVVNAVEAEMLGTARVDSLDGASAAAGELRGLAPSVVVTAGPHGVAANSATGSVALPAHPVTRVETHGAGDVFVGALAARLAGGATIAQALGYANAAAALHVGSPEAERESLGPADVERVLSSADVQNADD